MWKILSDGSAHNRENFARLLIKHKTVVFSTPHRSECVAVFKKVADAKQFIADTVKRFNEEEHHGKAVADS